MTGDLTIKISPDEPQVLARYLIGRECSSGIVQHYTEAVTMLNAALTDTEQRTWDKMIASWFYMKLADSGLAIVNPQSPLRKRIFIMLAILEASPDNTEYFLPQRRSIFYLVPLGFRMVLSAIFLVVGVLTVKVAGIGK